MKNFDKGFNLLIGKLNLNFNVFDVLQVFHFEEIRLNSLWILTEEIRFILWKF